ncbi:TonB-dependent receptor [Flammeovirgaceae bacterium SG7u.111]|nr:TonB-dependent receptor [Flammeovirgaceae bacterium SG7u.132]WPO36905.1 TonB-dependent receptor [Flammeovirgaceae bacterium SG7u.111]
MKKKELLIGVMLTLYPLLFSGALFAQSSITGTVISGEDSQPLPGVSVVIKGTSTGTITDIDGKYKLDAAQGSTLVFSYIGFLSEEIELGSQNIVDITLILDLKQLEEVIVVGYGTQDKRDVTAAIGSIDSEQINKIPVANGVQAMQGQVAGVDIQSGGGRPGSGPSVRIRGRRSITASNNPLYVIDGIPQASTSSSALNDINPQDIASMEVLKDAAATAIYGSRGANGVILITTKRGKSGKTQVSYNGYYGVTDIMNKVDMMNGEEFADMKRESRRDGYNGAIPADDAVFDDPIELESIAQGRSTDYQDLVFSQGYQTSHQVSVMGGSDKTQFNMSVGYFDEQGIYSNMDYNRITGRVNLDHKISNIFKAGISFLAVQSLQNYGSNATLGEALSNNPLGVPYDEDGNLRFLPTNDGIRTNPLNELVENAFIDERTVGRIFAPIYLEATITEGLKYRANFGPDIIYKRNGGFRGSLTNANRGGPASADIQNEKETNLLLENLITYDKKIGDKHELKFTFLQSIQSQRYEKHRTEVSNLPYESQLFYNIGSAEVKGNLESRLEEWQLASFMGRVNYDLAGKYLFQATLRADASSRLAEGNKWQYFPGFSAGWRVIDEAFMEGIGFLSELKLRASYGWVGNTSIDPYKTWGNLARTTYAWDESPAFGYRLNEIPNSELTWEVTKTLNVGFDYGLLDGRLSGSFEWYKSNTDDILLNRNLPTTSGYGQVLQNIGKTETTGIEFNIGAIVLDKPNGLNWDINFNISTYNEKIVDIGLYDENGNPKDDVGNKWFIGQPIKVHYDYQKAGIWQLGEETLANEMENKVPGEIKRADLSGPDGVPDGEITSDDRVILGTDIPDYLGGITNNFSYKGFDLSVFFYFRMGQMINSNFHRGFNSLFARYNNLDVDYWTVDNPTNAYPRPNENQESPRDSDTMRYFDGSFVKLRNITMGYNFPTSFANKLKMSSLRVYASAQNPWFWSNYETYDPEINDNDDNNNINDISSDNVPTSRLILLGLNVKF